MPQSRPASLGAGVTGQEDGLGGVVIAGEVVRRVAVLLVQIAFGGRSRGRQAVRGRILPGGIGSSGEESRPRLGVGIASAGPVTTVSAVAESLRRLGADLQQVDGERPRLREYIDNLKTEREAARQRLAEAEFALEAAQSEQEAAEEFRNANARAARIVGRVSLYVETVKLVNEQETLQAAVKKAETEVERLESLLAEDGEQDLLASILNRMGQRMTTWSELLQLEHRAPYRFDLNNLTVVADRPGRPIPMQRMGGGKNALGCHLLALLALHEHFV